MPKMQPDQSPSEGHPACKMLLVFKGTIFCGVKKETKQKTNLPGTLKKDRLKPNKLLTSFHFPTSACLAKGVARKDRRQEVPSTRPRDPIFAVELPIGGACWAITSFSHFASVRHGKAERSTSCKRCCKRELAFPFPLNLPRPPTAFAATSNHQNFQTPLFRPKRQDVFNTQAKVMRA